MQTLNAIPYMPTQVSQKSDYSGSKSNSTDKQNDFSKALDKEFSQNQNQETKVETSEPPTQNTTVEKPEQNTENAEAWAAVQNPLLQQIPQILEQTTVQSAVQGEAAVPTEEGITGLEPVQTGENVQQKQTGEKSANINLQDSESQEDGFRTVKVATDAINNADAVKNESAGTKTEGQTVEIDSKANVQSIQTGSSAQELANQNQMETSRNDGAVEIIQPEKQAAMQKTAFEMPKPVQTATVDLTDMRAGLQKLSETMTKQILQGKTEMEIWLEPANLGKLAIKVAYEGGRTAISIMCMNNKTMDIMAQNAKNLGTILEQQTGTNTVVIVEQKEADYLEQQKNQEQQNGKESQGQNDNQNNKDNDNEAENQSFLQQLRLGLM